MVDLEHRPTGYQEGHAAEDTDPGCQPGGEGVLEVRSKLKDKGGGHVGGQKKNKL